MRRERREVGVEARPDPLLVGPGDPRDQRGLVHDVALPAARGRESRQRAVARPRSCAPCGPRDLPAQRFLGRGLVQPVHVQALVRTQQQRLVREEAHLFAIRGDARGNGPRALRFARAVLPSGDPDAGDEPPQVPFPSPGMSFVEIVEIDDEVQFGRSVEPEVSEMSVAADHRHDARRRKRSDVGGHHVCRAAQESVWRGDHTADAYRNQSFESALVRELDLRDGVDAVRRGLPDRERAARHRLAQALSELEALRARNRPAAQRAVAVAVDAPENVMTG